MRGAGLGNDKNGGRSRSNPNDKWTCASVPGIGRDSISSGFVRAAPCSGSTGDLERTRFGAGNPRLSMGINP